MIFVTVGTQLPFDRLIKTVDDFSDDLSESVFAQTGLTSYLAKNIETTPFVSPSQSEEYFKKATLIIAHAGMGSILTALKYKKPILVMPRKASLGEHRNEHQLATANWVNVLEGVVVANDELQLLNILKKKDELFSEAEISPFAESRLLEFLKDEINS